MNYTRVFPLPSMTSVPRPGLGLAAQRATVHAEADRRGLTMVEVFDEVAAGQDATALTT